MAPLGGVMFSPISKRKDQIILSFFCASIIFGCTTTPKLADESTPKVSSSVDGEERRNPMERFGKIGEGTLRNGDIAKCDMSVGVIKQITDSGGRINLRTDSGVYTFNAKECRMLLYPILVFRNDTYSSFSSDRSPKIGDVIRCRGEDGLVVNFEPDGYFHLVRFLDTGRVAVLSNWDNCAFRVRIHPSLIDLDLTRPDRELLEAVLEGERENSLGIERALASNANVNARSPDGHTALMIAARKGYVRSVKLLLAANADVSGALRCNRNLEIVRLLVAAKADVNERDKNGETALMCAAWRDVEIVKLLLKAGADVNAQSLATEVLPDGSRSAPMGSDGETAIMQAIIAGNVEIRKLLIEAKADTDHIRSRRFGTAAELMALHSRAPRNDAPNCREVIPCVNKCASISNFTAQQQCAKNCEALYVSCGERMIQYYKRH
jgi:hypothetical protein